MNEQIKERWHEATNELVTKLEIKGIDFSKLNAIELFSIAFSGWSLNCKNGTFDSCR